jgi:proteasome lid subunit RPN8/RPN11
MAILQAPTIRHRFQLELWNGRQRVHAVPLERTDFARAIEAAFFDALRRGVVERYDPHPETARLEPCFALEEGSPVATGFTVALPTPAGEHCLRLPAEYFQTTSRRIGAELILQGKLPNNTLLHYRLTALADDAPETLRPGLTLELESEAPAIPIRPGSRRDFGATEAWDSPGVDDFPVLIPRQVVQEAVDEAARHPEREVGGVLLGHLRRDGERGELFLEVTCFVPAEETEATDQSVTFTPATWARVREVIDWRGEGEIFAGWVHSHPFRFCAECPLPVPAECVGKVLFYSSDDEFLMELSFARPFMVGLLAGVEPRLEGVLGHLPVRLYGWKDGLIQARGFEVFDS